nr:hypothetical protein [Cupriavidus pauculus]
MTTYQVMTPFGAFEARWTDDEESPVQYQGGTDAIAFFRSYLELHPVPGRDGGLVQFDALEPADLYGFCQSEEFGITVLPDRADTEEELGEERTELATGTPAAPVLDSVDNAEAFVLIGEGAQILAGLDEGAESFFADLSRLREIIQALGDDAKPAPVASSKSAQFDAYRAAIEKLLADGQPVPDGMLEQISVDTRLEDGEDEELLAIARGAAPEPEAVAPVALTGTELGEFPDTPEGLKDLRGAAMDAYEAMLGQWVACPALGADVELRKSGMKKVKALSGDPRKLKLVAALKQIIHGARKVAEKPSYDAQETSVRAYHYLRAQVTLAGEELAVRLVIKEDNQGAFHWDHTVRSGAQAVFDSAQEKGPAAADPIPAATSNGGPGRTGGTRMVSCQPDTSVQQTGADGNPAAVLDDATSGRLVFNLFIEGELPEEVAEEPDAEPIEPTKEPVSMETLIRIAADSIDKLRRIDVYRVLQAAEGQRAELAGYIIANRPELTEEVTAVMAEEFPDVEWNKVQQDTPHPPVAKVERQDGTSAEISPAAQARSADLAFLRGVSAQSVDMWADDLADRLEGVIAGYEGDQEVEDEWKQAVNAYTDFMAKAIATPVPA